MHGYQVPNEVRWKIEEVLGPVGNRWPSESQLRGELMETRQLQASAARLGLRVVANKLTEAINRSARGGPQMVYVRNTSNGLFSKKQYANIQSFAEMVTARTHPIKSAKMDGNRLTISYDDDDGIPGGADDWFELEIISMATRPVNEQDASEIVAALNARMG